LVAAYFSVTKKTKRQKDKKTKRQKDKKIIDEEIIDEEISQINKSTIKRFHKLITYNS
jgi:hypothetical protein